MAFRRRAAPISLCLLVTAVTLLPAQVTARALPALGEASTFSTIEVTVMIDLGSSGELLGSYGASLTWDPAVLQYQGDPGGGDSPFDAAVVNRSDVLAGVLRFSDASPAGLGGDVKVFSATFTVIADPPAMSALDLEFSSLFAAGSFQDLAPGLLVADGEVRVTSFALVLRAVTSAATLFEWNAAPGAVTYDLVRGDVGSLLDDGAAVHLGSLACIENDSQDTTTGPGTEGANPDLTIPAAGEAFFYLLTFNNGATNTTYGFSFPALYERLADSGGCP